MNSSALPPGPSPETSGVLTMKHPRWQHIYFVLAAFNLLAVCAGLYLSHRLMGIYAESVRTNREWSQRLTAYADIAQLVTAVNAPANDAFDSRDVPAESAKMEAALARFNEKMRTVREDVDVNLPVAEAKRLLRQMCKTLWMKWWSRPKEFSPSSNVTSSHRPGNALRGWIESLLRPIPPW